MSSKRRVIILRLQGGHDSLSALIPLQFELQKYRPRLFKEISKNGIKLDENYSLNNNLSDLLRLKERNLNEIILNQDAIKTTYESDIKRLRRQLYFQKVQKTIFGGVGLLTSGVFLYLYVTK
jgi:uncharacterized protein (DUF1501 family)